ncbi:MAG: hypothetical protein ACJ786_07870 [Catenulispora sp.]
MSVQRGDLVAGRYRIGEPLGPAWRAHDERDTAEVLLVPTDGAGALDPSLWRDRRGILPATGSATGDAGAWLVTAPIAARTLRDAVTQWGALPAEQVLMIAAGAVTALSGVGPRPSAAADHILLTDEGKVLLLPTPATDDALFELGASLFQAAEGRSPFDPGTGDPRQPTLAPLIRILMSRDLDHAATLDRTHAELSRLGAPVDTQHGADTMREAQAASAAAAVSGDAGNEPTHVAQPPETPTQPMSAAELLAETGEGEAVAEPEVPTQLMSAAELADTGEDSLSAAEATPATEPTNAAAESDAQPDDQATRSVPIVEAPSATETPTQPISAAELADTGEAALPDNEETRPVPVIEPTPATEAPTQSMSAADLADTGEVAPPDDEATRRVPVIDAPARTASDGPDADVTRPVPTIAASDAVPDHDHDHQVTRPVPMFTPAIPSPEPELPPTKPEQLPMAPSPFVPPTQAAAAVPPQPQPQPQPQPFQSSAPPTQAASAYSAAPAAPNPWLQPPQPPQPAQNPWQNQGGPGQPGLGQPQPGPGQPGPWGQNQPPGPPFYPVPGPPPLPPKRNSGKTVGIVVGAMATVAAIVLVVIFATKGSGSSDKVDNAANSSSHTTSGPSGTTSPTASTHSSSSAATTSSSSDSPSDTDSSSESPSDSESSSSDAYTPPPDLTSTPFDPAVLDDFHKDKTPLTLEALAPEDFTDDKGVHYSLKAGSVQPCVQTDMSENMRDILTSNSCTKEIAASYVDDSGQYLVSVKILPLPDHHTATTVYDDLAQQSAADFGIWCPKDGPGSGACDGDYRSATIKQYREEQHRYIILSVALAVNHSESSTIAPWLESAAQKAVDVAGPDNWPGNE